MTALIAARTPLRILPALLGLALLSGCQSDGYPTDLHYPPRTDPLVIKGAERDAPNIDLPGDFPTLFVGLTPEEKSKLLLDPAAKLSDGQRQQLQAALDKYFGTPADPRVDGIGDDVRQALKLDNATILRGGMEYRHQCLHCHGLSGDGHGPTAPWVNPHPRDYRQGRFKFTSSSQDEGVRKPRREDLFRTLYEGIDGSSMPSFRLLGDETLDALVSYVIHLSLRGETEFIAIQDLVESGASQLSPEDFKSQYLDAIVGRWMDAAKAMIDPGPYPITNEEQRRAAARRGWDLFIKPGEAGCISCHTDYGRQSPWKYDAWGTMVRPLDLTRGVYRGGRRPIDLYWRIHSGINGAGMTAFGKNLQPPQIWDLVTFLQVLPYPQMRKAYGIEID